MGQAVYSGKLYICF